MSNAPRNNNYYWDNGAFCENCGILTGNVTNNGILPIWHTGCKPGCNSVWYDQDPMSDDDEDQDEEQELASQRSERDIEYDRRYELCKTPIERTEEFELWANEWGLRKEWDEEFELEHEERAEMESEDHNVLKVVEVDWETLAKESRDYIAEYRHPYHEDDEELELEARAQYEREMEAEEREQDAMEEREYQASRGRYYDLYDDDMEYEADYYY